MIAAGNAREATPSGYLQSCPESFFFPSGFRKYGAKKFIARRFWPFGQSPLRKRKRGCPKTPY
jgi:hypothetical protein